MKRLLLLILIGASSLAHAQSYQLPNDNTGCPNNCRQIPWLAGADVWNGGVLPTYTNVTCTGLAGNGTTNDGPAIQSCINALGTNQCAFVPAGVYLINSTVRLKSNTCLRGAKPEGVAPFLPAADAAATTFNTGTSYQLTTQNFSFDSGGLDPPVHYSVQSPGYTITNAPQKGDTTFTKGTGTLTVGDWIHLFSDDDPSLVNGTGTDGHCDWCGDNSGHNFMNQIVAVTAVSGSTITISRPFYYTPFTHPQYRKQTFPTQKSGFENFRVNGATGDTGSGQLVNLQGCLYCWVKGVETYDTGNNSLSAHIEMDEDYANEIRDNYVHLGRSSASGANYGIYQQWVNSDNKIENNILRNNRHSLIMQGGGSGTAYLYNYVDDQYTDDLTYMGSSRADHGAHPYMNLWEGNVMSHWASDDFWGTSSHQVLFRNWLWGGETGTGVPSFPPNNGFVAIDLYTLNPYFSFVGNVLGTNSSLVTLGVAGNWSNATLQLYDTQPSNTAPVVYSAGPASGSIPSSSATALYHGNYDFKTNGVAFWNGGSNHTLAASIYYSTKPAFFGGCAWPGIGPDISPVATTSMPAFNRYKGTSCGAPPTTFPLSVAKAGTGGGTIASSPSGISCGSTCSANFNSGTAVTLTATPDGASTFGGWSGACSGIGTCSVTVNSSTSATATFTTTPPSGPVTFSPPSGTYAGPVNVALSSASPLIFYTRNGSTPNPASTQYASPIAISAATTLQAIAAAGGSVRRNTQATASLWKICTPLGGGPGTPASVMCGGVGSNQPAGWTITYGTTESISLTGTTGTPQILVTLGGSGCDSCTEETMDKWVKPLNALGHVQNHEMDAWHNDGAHNRLHMGGLQCNQQPGKLNWQVDNEQGSWQNTNITDGCPLSTTLWTHVVFHTHWTIGDTGCGGLGCTFYDYLEVCQASSPAVGCTLNHHVINMQLESDNPGWSGGCADQDQVDLNPGSTVSNPFTGGVLVQANNVTCAFGVTATSSANYSFTTLNPIINFSGHIQLSGQIHIQ